MIPIIILAAVLSAFGGPVAADAGGGSPTIILFDAGGGTPTVFDAGGGSPTHP